METKNLKAYAKINLTLDVFDKRDDGYHNQKAIFQKISLYDEIIITKTEGNGFELETNVQGLNTENNTLYKAYLLLGSFFPQVKGIYVRLIKHIPIGAGLGGESTDCACFCQGINELFQLNLSTDELAQIIWRIGCDVAPCLYDRNVLMGGRGEFINDLHTQCKFYVVVIKPPFATSTKEMFQKWDERPSRSVFTYEREHNIINALNEGDIEKLAHNVYNVFEPLSDSMYSKRLLAQYGALNSSLTGTGSCVYGIFDNVHGAKMAYQELCSEQEVYLCESYYGENDCEFQYPVKEKKYIPSHQIRAFRR